MWASVEIAMSFSPLYLLIEFFATLLFDVRHNGTLGLAHLLNEPPPLFHFFFTSLGQFLSDVLATFVFLCSSLHVCLSYAESLLGAILMNAFFSLAFRIVRGT